jgi:DNA-binding NtrC family response regulator
MKGDNPRTRKKFPPIHVLVVDDEPLVRWSIAETLRTRGYEVTEASNADGTIRAIADQGLLPDVVLLDLRLPDCDDMSLLATLRRIVPDARVIVMSAFGTPEIFEAVRHLGVETIIEKPFDLDRVETLIGAALGTGYAH